MRRWRRRCRSFPRKPKKGEEPTTKPLLASELGTSSETFSRALTQFRNQRLLSVDGKTVTVLCPSRLAALLRGHPVGM